MIRTGRGCGGCFACSSNGIVLSPHQHPSGQKIDYRHWQHIAHDGHHEGQPQGQAVYHAVGDGTPQLEQRHHGDEKDDKNVFEHIGSFLY